jgi:hypothetical protein
MVLVLATIIIWPEPYLTMMGAHCRVHAIKKVGRCVYYAYHTELCKWWLESTCPWYSSEQNFDHETRILITRYYIRIQICVTLFLKVITGHAKASAAAVWLRKCLVRSSIWRQYGEPYSHGHGCVSGVMVCGCGCFRSNYSCYNKVRRQEA